jgi:hypothetical protein
MLLAKGSERNLRGGSPGIIKHLRSASNEAPSGWTRRRRRAKKNHGGARGPPELEQGRAESRIQGLDKRRAAGGRKWRQQRQGGGLAARSNRLSLEERGWLERGVRWAVPVRVGFGLSVSFVLLGRTGA